jgi:hypothetical protein
VTQRLTHPTPTPRSTIRTLVFTQHDLAAFIAGAKNGDFDHLLD